MSDGYLVKWITTSKALKSHLVSEMPTSDVLYLSPSDYKNMECKGRTSDININEVLDVDRILKNSSRNKELIYSQSIEVEQFLRHSNVSLIVGELTWAHELLVYRIASKVLAITHVNPHTIRIPDNRIAFFIDEEQSKALALENGDIIEKIEPKKPKYLKYNNEKIRAASSITYRVKRLLTSIVRNRNVDPEDQTKFSSWSQWFFNRLREGVYRDIYRLLERSFNANKISEPYILYTLHKQPEASADVIGSYFSNQEILIERLWAALPDGWNLIVKEHSNAIGDRSPLFYICLKTRPNLYFEKISTDSYHLIREAKAVFTISGTSAYESALMGVPSFTFSNCFFNVHPLCRRVSIADLKYEGIKSLIGNALCATTKSSDSLIEWLEKYSMIGEVGDPIRLPSCIESANIHNIARALKSMA